MRMFHSPPTAPPAAPLPPDITVERDKPENLKEYMRALKARAREEHGRGTITEAERDRRIGAFESVRTDADPLTQFATIAGDATLLGPETLVGRDFFAAGKTENLGVRKQLLAQSDTNADSIFTDPATRDTQIAAAREMFARGEYYRDEKPIRETVWRAMNPNAGPGTTMPENFEMTSVSPEMQQKAEGFVTARQDALRGRSIAAILGQGVTGRKKNFSYEQREQMLKDLDGIISPSDYQTLDTALQREKDPSYEPPVPGGGTYGIRGRASRAANEAAYTADLARLANVEQDGKTAYHGATRDFYSELGQTRFEQELALELADPSVITNPAQRQEIERQLVALGNPSRITDATRRQEIEKELRKEVAIKIVLQSMRGTDQDFERMKQEQFLEYKDKVRFEKLRKAYSELRRKHPAITSITRAATIAICAGAGAGVIAGIGATSIFGFTFFGAGMAAFPTIFATRAVTSGIFSGIGAITAPFMDKWRKKNYARKRKGTEKTGATSAELALQQMTGAITLASLIAEMQRSSQAIQAEQNKLTKQEQSFLRRAGWSALPTLGAGLLLGVVPRVAAAEIATLTSPSGTPPLGDPPDPYAVPSTSFMPPEAPLPKSGFDQFAEALGKPFRDALNWFGIGKPDSVPGSGTGHGAASSLASEINLPNDPSASMPASSARSFIETARPGKGVWNMLGDPNGQLQKHYPEFGKLKPAQQRYIIDALDKKVIAHPEIVGLKNAHMVRANQQINFEKLFADPKEVDAIFTRAKALTPAQMENIMRSGPPTRPRVVHHRVTHPAPKPPPSAPLFNKLTPEEKYAVNRPTVDRVPPQPISHIDHTATNIEHFRFRSSYDPQEWDKINKSTTIKELGDEIDRLEKVVPLSSTDNGGPVTSDVLRGVIGPHDVSRLRGMHNELHKAATFAAEGMGRISEDLARTKGGVTGSPSPQEIREMVRLKKALVNEFETGITIGDAFREIDLTKLPKK